MDNQKKRDLGEKLLHLSFLLTHRVVNPMGVLRSCALPLSHVKVLYFLKMHGEHSMSKLSEVLSMSRSNMTPVVDGLIEDALVERYGDPKDRRVQRIQLTEKGIGYLKELDERIKEQALERLEILDEDTLHGLDEAVDVLLDVAKRLEQKEASGDSGP